MAEFQQKSVITIADYNLYCHYVAGLVGIGLSELFAASGLENPRFKELTELSNSMGLFLQKGFKIPFFWRQVWTSFFFSLFHLCSQHHSWLSGRFRTKTTKNILSTRNLVQICWKFWGHEIRRTQTTGIELFEPHDLRCCTTYPRLHRLFANVIRKTRKRCDKILPEKYAQQHFRHLQFTSFARFHKWWRLLHLSYVTTTMKCSNAKSKSEKDLQWRFSI